MATNRWKRPKRWLLWDETPGLSPFFLPSEIIHFIKIGAVSNSNIMGGSFGAVCKIDFKKATLLAALSAKRETSGEIMCLLLKKSHARNLDMDLMYIARDSFFTTFARSSETSKSASPSASFSSSLHQIHFLFHPTTAQICYHQHNRIQPQRFVLGIWIWSRGRFLQATARLQTKKLKMLLSHLK